MEVQDLVDWINYFISDASRDDNVPRRVARIKALIGVRKQIQTLKSISHNTINNLNISSYMKNKILQLLIDNKKAPPTNLVDELANIHGLGYPRAKLLVKEGVATISDLKKSNIFKNLPIETQMWLKYKPLEKIPRPTIIKFAANLAKIFFNIKWDIAGSYRREKLQSSDIDLVIIEDLNVVVKKLATIYKIIPYASGVDKVSLLIKLDKHYAKLDIMRATTEDYPFQLLYLTGSREHNIKMRKVAKSLGYLLNQHGLYKNKQNIPLKSEKEIFKSLGMIYVDPKLR